MENTTKMVQTETRIKGSELLMDALPKSFTRIVSEITGYSETHIANIVRGEVFPKDPAFLETTVRIADFHLEFEERMNELLKPYTNAKSHKNRI